ncbi:MAG: hypothetical protein CM1200mP30_14730 [Pseudomonadota bacterium]|nr:MAG: hypothetical protein CM1200mP30_14730 [Pseudomonadota bacterium]
MGFSSVPNVINNIMMERISSVGAPTKGKILRPSDQKPVESIAFVQWLDQETKIICLTVLQYAALVP